MNSSPRENFTRGFKRTLFNILTDRAVLTVMIGAIILYSFFYPLGYREQVAKQQPIAIVDLDRSGQSRALIRAASAHSSIHIVAQPLQLLHAMSLIERGEIEGILVISDGFEKAILQGITGNVDLYGNGAYLSRANTVLTGMAEVLTGFAAQAAITQAAFSGKPSAAPIHIIQRPLFNTREGYGSAVVTGVAELILHQTLLIGICVMAGTRREKTGKITLNGWQLLGVASACLMIGYTNFLYYSGFMFWFQDYPMAGNIRGALLIGILFMATVVAFGLFIASFFKTRERAYQIILITSLPLFFLSGLPWPTAEMPLIFTWLANLLPSSAGILVMVQLNQMGASLSEANKEITILLVQLFGYSTLAYLRFKPQRKMRSAHTAKPLATLPK